MATEKNDRKLKRRGEKKMKRTATNKKKFQSAEQRKKKLKKSVLWRIDFRFIQ
jgi:hypothetical protein